MIKDIRFLSFEIGTTCNLSNKHSWCPINDQLRYPLHESKLLLNDNDIVKFAKSVISRGFNGEIAFHYYNEPCLSPDRMKNIMNQLPVAKFILWTNGLLLRNLDQKLIKSMNRVCISIYELDKMDYFNNFCKQFSNMTASLAPHDARANVYKAPAANPGFCIRPSQTEIAINAYGNLRMCCSDFRGQVSLGNITLEDHNFLLDAWEEMAILIQEYGSHLCSQCRSIHSPCIMT